MLKFRFQVINLIFLIVISFSATQAQNWPNWRGPSGDGTSIETNLPTNWDSTTNVIWKSPVPGTGHSSPIIWEDKLFTITALPEIKEKRLFVTMLKMGIYCGKKPCSNLHLKTNTMTTVMHQARLQQTAT